jgi:hypothetical protein
MKADKGTHSSMAAIRLEASNSSSSRDREAEANFSFKAAFHSADGMSQEGL